MKPIPVTDTRTQTLESGERREHTRFDTMMPCLLHIDGIEHRGVVENLSLGGALLDIAGLGLKPSQVSAEGLVEFFVEEDFAIPTRCRIVNVSDGQASYPTLVSVDFIQPNEDAIAALIDTDI